jgi:predicted N-acyltransferase
MISVERLDSVASIDRTEWDRLAGDDVFGSWGWLRTVEETHLAAARVGYFVARDSDQLLAAVPFFFQDTTTAYGTPDLVLFGLFAPYAQALGIGVLPAFVCGQPFGLADGVLVARERPVEERWSLAGHLIAAIENIAAGERCTLCFRNVVGDGAEIARTLRTRRYVRAREMPTTVLEVRWSSFADYVRALKRRHPKTAQNIPREKHRALRAGVTLGELADPSALEERLHTLLDRHHRRLNGVPFPYGRGFLSALKRNLGDQAILFVAAKDGDPVSIVIGLRGGTALYLVMVGLDEIQSRRGFVYFNNSYNEPIRYAIEKGVRRVYSGKLVYEAKVRRGFDLLRLDMYVFVPRRLHAAVLRPLSAWQAARIHSKVARETRVRW